MEETKNNETSKSNDERDHDEGKMNNGELGGSMGTKRESIKDEQRGQDETVSTGQSLKDAASQSNDNSRQ